MNHDALRAAHQLRLRTAEARMHCAIIALRDLAGELADPLPTLAAEVLLTGERAVLVRLAARIGAARDILRSDMEGEVA